MVVVWDFTTRGPIQVLEGQVKPIVSLSWSRKSRFLLSASRDWNVILWDLKTGTRRNTLRFEAPVTSAALHPKNRYAAGNDPPAVVVGFNLNLLHSIVKLWP